MGGSEPSGTPSSGDYHHDEHYTALSTSRSLDPYNQATYAGDGVGETSTHIRDRFRHHIKHGNEITPRCPPSNTHIQTSLIYGKWDPGIFNTYSGAWVYMADFQLHTGLPFKLKSFTTCKDTVRYLGWDPQTDPNPNTPSWPPPPPAFSLKPEYEPDGNGEAWYI
eukprot:jgi/Psemu1/58984/gm1.58984_g